MQRAETDFFTGEPLNALSTLVYSQNIDLQRSASLTFAEITERGKAKDIRKMMERLLITLSRRETRGQGHSRAYPLPSRKPGYRGPAGCLGRPGQSCCRWYLTTLRHSHKHRLLTIRRPKQSTDRLPQRTYSSYPADELAQRRSAMQRCWLYHEPRHT